MADTLKQRQMISKYFNCIRFIQAQQNRKERKTVESLREFSEIARSTADKIVNYFKAEGVVNNKLILNPTYSVFMGISVLYDGIKISVVGMDGTEISWKETFKSNRTIAELMGKLDVEYSIEGLIKSSILISEIIKRVHQALPLKAICFSFDDVDLSNATFSYTSYFEQNDTKEYNIHDFCKAFLQNISVLDISVNLESNAMSQLIASEFPLVENLNSSVYIDMQENGIFAAILVHNKIYYGYNLQSINLSKLLNEEEKRNLKSGTLNKEQLCSIVKKIVSPYAVTLNPELISISGKIVSTNSREFDFIIFEKEKILEECGARNYRPEFRIIPNSNYSRGAAISAMYHYYNWDGTCIKHF